MTFKKGKINLGTAQIKKKLEKKNENGRRPQHLPIARADSSLPTPRILRRSQNFEISGCYPFYPSFLLVGGGTHISITQNCCSSFSISPSILESLMNFKGLKAQ